MDLVIPLLLVFGPVAGLIWWEVSKKQRSGLGWDAYFKQQAYDKRVKRAQEQMLLGQVEGMIVREAQQRFDGLP